MARKVLLLGNTGFIGRYIESAVKSLSGKPEYLGLSRSECDLEDKQQAARLSELVTPETALIITSGIKRQYGDSFEIFDRNMRMILNLCSALENRPMERIIYLSSAAVYGEDIHNTSINEKTLVDPKSLYGTGRFAAERLLGRVGSPLAVLRPPLVYGCGDLSRGYGPSGFYESIRLGQDIRLWGDGSEKREFLYVKDLAAITVALLSATFTGVINPVSGKSRTYAECAAILKKLTGAKSNITEQPRSKEKVDHVFGTSLIFTTLPGFRFTPFENGLEDMVALEQRQN